MADESPAGADELGAEPVQTVAEQPTLYGCALTDARGQAVIHPTREQYLDVMRAAADDGYTVAMDVTAVDYLEYINRPLPDGVARERFEVVVNLLDMRGRRRLRARVQVPESDPTLPTLFDLHPGTEAFEREVYDMFGIEFSGHPDLSRILMPEDWDGHPLRKDYDVGAIPVKFKHVGVR